MSTEPSVSMHAIPGKSTLAPARTAAPARSDASSASVNQEAPCAAASGQSVSMAQQPSPSAEVEAAGASGGEYTINVDPRAHLLSAALAKHTATASANALLLEPDSSDEAHPQAGVAAASESSDGTMGYFGGVAEEARSALSCSDGTSTDLNDVLHLVAKPVIMGDDAPPPGM